MCAALGALEELCRSTPTRVPMRALPVRVVVSVLLSQVYLVCRLTRPESELSDLNCEGSGELLYRKSMHSIGKRS